MILVTVGTHPDPFDRLVTAAEVLGAMGEEEVVVQTGTSGVPTPNCRAAEMLSPAELDALVARARVVVTHAGPASIFQALGHGKVPIVVPRRADLGEHVDDHQVRFVAHVRHRVNVLEDPSKLPQAVAEHEARCASLEAPRVEEERTEAFSLAVAEVADALVHPDRPRGRGLRARLAAVLTYSRER